MSLIPDYITCWQCGAIVECQKNVWDHFCSDECADAYCDELILEDIRRLSK